MVPTQLRNDGLSLPEECGRSSSWQLSPLETDRHSEIKMVIHNYTKLVSWSVASFQKVKFFFSNSFLKVFFFFPKSFSVPYYIISIPPPPTPPQMLAFSKVFCFSFVSFVESVSDVLSFSFFFFFFFCGSKWVGFLSGRLWRLRKGESDMVAEHGGSPEFPPGS